MEQLLDIVKNFKNQKILVVGDLMLDEYILGNVERISPEAPIPVLDVKEISHVPGGGANTAYNVKALGGTVSLVGVIGPEDKGLLLKNILQEKGINIEGLFIDENRKTTVKTRAVTKKQQLVRIDFEDRNPIDSEMENKIIDFIRGKIKECRAVIISDYVKGVVTENLARNIVSLAKENNVLCLVDSKADNYLKYRNCDYVVPNEKELARVLNLPINNDGQFAQAGKMLLYQVSCNDVLVKRGEKGMVLFERDGSLLVFPVVNKKAIDVSGAGDTAVAAFALSLAAGASPKEAMELASHACGIVVGKVGTATALPEELEASLKNNLI